MTKFKNSQVIVLFVLVLLLVITPLLPSYVRPTYLYFIFNLLIIALGAEAGLLSVISRPLEERKLIDFIAQKPLSKPDDEKSQAQKSGNNNSVKNFDEKFVCVAKVEEKAPNCASMPSIFFVGGDDNDAEDENLEYDYYDDDLKDEEVEVGDEIARVNGQELFAKAEAFIGNFYKQLRMQREDGIYVEAWKRLAPSYEMTSLANAHSRWKRFCERRLFVENVKPFAK
ncbi:hypothetical protein PIB30_024948 [Stylosanthes scabra]|uniref:DUF4408 domain-containing protein n=1 Tax=Stylosanthes scabra TaxID=79078 RepID=A0ABU6V836_9FABA|nr:hypothetical protein [Stylosanthes scabra]